MSPLPFTSRSLPAPLLAAALALRLLAPGTADACGGFFCQITPVEQNAERILFEIDPEGIISTTVEISYAGEPEGFSWVVPVSATPTLEDVPPSALRLLDGGTVPTIIPPPTTCSGAAPPGIFRSSGANDAAEQGGGVTVEDLPQVGPFDPEVVSSDDPQALIEWLNTNGYLITEAMEPFVADYVASGMKFLAMKLTPGAGTADIVPIRMTYAGTSPMVPISLTSVSAEPEMGVMVFVAGAGRYESDNFANMTVDVADVQADPNSGANNYYPLLSWLIDEAGSRAFVTEYADTAQVTRQNIENFFGFFADDDAESRAFLNDVLARHAYVTRMYTRISGWEMAFDPSFARADSDATVSRTLDLSDRPAIEVCGPRNRAPEPCGQMYCGVDAMCATTDAGIDGCVCPAGTSARVIREPGSPGGFLRDTVTCQNTELEFLADVLGTVDGPDDPCGTATCGEFGQCVAVNGFPTCTCDDGFAAVADGAGGAVCSQVKETFTADTLLWSRAGCGGGCSVEPDATGAGGLLLLLGLLGPLVRRRRR
jgi:MYXO-CTERM domain-containing protein